MPPDRECPILVWMLSLNRDYMLEEYDACYKVVEECDPHAKIQYNPDDADSFRQLMAHLLPLLMMRHRRIPRSKWQDRVSPQGKHWIEQSPDDLPPDKFLHSMIGYHLAYDHSLCGMVMTQGTQRKVVNIGLGVKHFCVEPKGVTITAYAESLSHKLTPLEMSFITPDQGDETVLRRLCIILALKSAYIKAIGQPPGFDWSRLEFNVPNNTALGDGHPLQGWEFRIFKSNLGVLRRDSVIEEQYQCVTAFFRGYAESRFIWYEEAAELDPWVQFINIDQMIKVLPKLAT